MTNHALSTTEFVASEALAGDLQSVLVELLELQAQAKQAHWTVVGPHFRSIHLELDEIVDAVREHADTVAERMRALDAVPDGRTRTIANTTRLASFPEGEVSVERAVAVIGERIIAGSTPFVPCTTTSTHRTPPARTSCTPSSRRSRSSGGCSRRNCATSPTDPIRHRPGCRSAAWAVSCIRRAEAIDST